MSNRSPTDPQARAIALASLLLERYRSYHDHKETMAYGGATLFIGAVIAAVAADSWPPHWLTASKPMLIASVTGLWLLVLVFVKWQLRRRRWAAMRLAGVERLLAKWVVHLPSDADLETSTPPAIKTQTRLSKVRSWLGRTFVLLLDHVWPLKAARPAVDVSEAVYPKAFVEIWDNQLKGKGTEARFHEGLVVIAGWAAYAVLLMRTLAGPQPCH